jgi:hypothetical protein
MREPPAPTTMAFGVVPTGTVARTTLDAVSITETVLEAAFVA